MKEVFSAIMAQMEHGHDAMLVTVIRHAGSVPRGTGAQMAVGSDGRMAGTVGGGAGEKIMTRLAQDWLAQGKSDQYTYVLRSPGNGDEGGVCGGEITAHFQYIAADDARWRALIHALLERIEQRKKGRFVQRLDGGAPALIDADGRMLLGEANETEDDLFSMPIDIGERVVIFGAGHCAQALSPLLASVGFRVTIYDDRPELTTKAFFAQAEELICAPYAQIDAHLALDEDDYIVIMTHGHAGDQCVLEQVLGGEHAYIGMLSSRIKKKYVFDRMRERGVPQEKLDSVHTPVGLAIRAETPAEIAVSIAGEMILHRAMRREGAKQA